ncbi:putative acyl-activating enzyme 19 isoform X2 [Senna tora]|uniref:Putative acyl-activating enzyme 19 isoform X2 n=1 Tax=Senna tora TaxID=362788 RepID=A0A834W8E9_9FABA|nr:putative acyl-activating enzyme 19 isoform X2 [Senna tora]
MSSTYPVNDLGIHITSEFSLTSFFDISAYFPLTVPLTLSHLVFRTRVAYEGTYNPTINSFFQAYFISRLTAVPSLMRTILPVLQAHVDMRVRSSLKLLVFSGENFPLTLWEMLSNLLPKTSILNLYGSTEFDCKRMPMILKIDILTSVPIGLPISNCDVLLLGENDASNKGELYVGGSCISRGYYTLSNLMSDHFVKLPRSYGCGGCVDTCQSQLYIRTGDLAKKLPSGDLVFLGRKDRMVKVNGQRVALEEIENLLREHPDINDAAVICKNNQGELLHLEAFIILKDMERLGQLLTPSIKSWMINNLPSVMVPNHFIFTESFPMTSSGKVNYELVAGSTLFTKHAEDKVGNLGCSNLQQLVQMELKIRVEFSDAYFTDNARNLYTSNRKITIADGSVTTVVGLGNPSSQKDQTILEYSPFPELPVLCPQIIDPAFQPQQPSDPPQISPDPDLNLQTNQTLDSARPLQVYSRRKAPPPTSEPVQSSPLEPQDVEVIDSSSPHIHDYDVPIALTKGVFPFGMFYSIVFNSLKKQFSLQNEEIALLLHEQEFCDALMVEEVSNDEDFFQMGGKSLAAAHISKYDGSSSSPLKRLKRDLTTDITSGGDGYIPWCSSLMSLSCSFC